MQVFSFAPRFRVKLCIGKNFHEISRVQFFWSSVKVYNREVLIEKYRKIFKIRIKIELSQNFPRSRRNPIFSSDV